MQLANLRQTLAQVISDPLSPRGRSGRSWERSSTSSSCENSASIRLRVTAVASSAGPACCGGSPTDEEALSGTSSARPVQLLQHRNVQFEPGGLDQIR